ncbi:hypothetical protein [Leifsonia shinshuensis]|uniref:Uncharacterized protein n=1 Tax=Leifsonia shinshuensis TaxID=150026 RepID=A0A853CU86_9MICO|nr:hypothetical protein [Leifsonia shinshuensis]NYJ22370.1 hypothetical protein [Leifsonia shinshuensis]
MSARGSRVVRGFAAAGVATLVAALFHMAGGGQAPSALALTLSLVFSSLASIVLVGRRVALWRLALAVPVSQFLFHALFTLSPSATFSGMPADGHLHAGMHLTLVPGSAVASAGMAPAGMIAGPTFLGEDAGMWLAHAAAAALTIAVLLRGERTLLAVARFAFFRLTRFADRVAAVAPAPLRRVATPIDTVPASLRGVDALIGSLRHRGPPRVVVPAG